MTLVTFFVLLVILGLVWWLVENYLPLADPVKLVIRVVGVLILIFCLLALFNIMPLPFAVK